jgi:hypothetical protein
MPAAYSYRPRRQPRPCPDCGAALQRVRRTDEERALAQAQGLARYACQASACGWAGLLPASGRAARIAAARRPSVAVPGLVRALVARARGTRWLPLALAAAAGGVMATVVLQLATHSAPAQAQLVPGESHDGDALPASHPLLAMAATGVALSEADAPAAAAAGSAPPGKATTALSLRRGCAWGKPGRNPYRGTVAQALSAARLPPEVIRAIAAQVSSGQPVDELVITPQQMRAQRSGRQFDPHNIAMTYGTTLCVGTRVNFVPGHSERAALYEARDKSGRNYAVMVPQVCGNVSVIGEVARVDGAATHSEGGAQATRGGGDAAYWMPAVLTPGGGTNTVPEPGTLVSVLMALVLMAALRRRP